MTERAPLLAWYAAHKRDLPWRRDPRPWPVWVSEVMLQQTRVESVLPYFERFLVRFPTPAALAAAPLDEVLTLWAGLGYYRRARHLHAAAAQVVERHGGEVPADAEAFGALTGVGRYTCGAVQSIAFGHRAPVLDGNVERVLCRLDRVALDPRAPDVRRGLWARAAKLADHPRPGDVNQALMELGATVCTPRSPRCEACPLSAVCAARAGGDAERLPIKAARPERARVVVVAGLSRDDAGRIWMARRPDEGLLAGLWELPGVEVPSADPAHLGALGMRAGGEPVVIEHGFTHRVWTLHVFRALGTPARSHHSAVRAVAEADLAALALSGPTLKALRACGVPLAHRRGAGRRPAAERPPSASNR